MGKNLIEMEKAFIQIALKMVNRLITTRPNHNLKLIYHCILPFCISTPSPSLSWLKKKNKHKRNQKKKKHTLKKKPKLLTLHCGTRHVKTWMWHCGQGGYTPSPFQQSNFKKWLYNEIKLKLNKLIKSFFQGFSLSSNKN